LLAQVRWFSPGIPASSTTKIGHHDIAEILLKVALNTKSQSINHSFFKSSVYFPRYMLIYTYLLSSHEKEVYDNLVRVVGNEMDIRIRQNMFLIKDKIYNKVNPEKTQLSSGSLAEGLVKSRQYNGLQKKKQKKVDNTMVKRKTNRQKSTIQWPKEKQTGKGRQYNGQKKNKQTKVDNTIV
jgi:thiol:disulfide interchange protein